MRDFDTQIVNVLSLSGMSPVKLTADMDLEAVCKLIKKVCVFSPSRISILKLFLKKLVDTC